MPSTQRFQRFLNSVGAHSKCEVCGVNNWDLPDDEVEVIISIPTAREIRGGYSNASGGALRTVVAVCQNCGNVRFHALQIVKDKEGI